MSCLTRVVESLQRRAVELAKSRTFHRKADENMKEKASVLDRMMRGEDGPTAIEYTVILSVVVLVCVTALANMGPRSSSRSNNMAQQTSTTQR